ncbi:MAG: hypothetical protein ACTHN5_02035 [Phycisphaerae bacterium]
MEVFLLLGKAFFYLWVFTLGKIFKPRGKLLIFYCPICKQNRAGREFAFHAYSRSGLMRRPMNADFILHCDTCKEAFNADAFFTNPHGIRQLRTWDCPKCSANNPNSTFNCLKCGYGLI